MNPLIKLISTFALVAILILGLVACIETASPSSRPTAKVTSSRPTAQVTSLPPTAKVIIAATVIDLLIKSPVNDIDRKQQWQRISNKYNGVTVQISGSLHTVMVDASGPYVDIQDGGEWVTAHFKSKYESSMAPLKYGTLVVIQGVVSVSVPDDGHGRVQLLDCDLVQVPGNPTPTPTPTPTTPAFLTPPTTASGVPPKSVATLISNDPSELVLALNDFPVGWQLQDKGVEEGGYHSYMLKIGAIVAYPDIVDSWVRVFPAVSSAQAAYSDKKAQITATFATASASLGDESVTYAGNGMFVVCFRSNNVLATVTMWTNYGGSLTAAKQWATILAKKIDSVKP